MPRYPFNQDPQWEDLGNDQVGQRVVQKGSNPQDAKTVGAGDINSLSSGFNGTTWDRWRNNTEGVLLASASRSSAPTTSIQTNYNHRGVVVFLDVTAASGTGGLAIEIHGVDPVTGKAIKLNSNMTLITATGVYEAILYPGMSHSSGDANVPLPRKWQVKIYHGDGSSYTYSVGHSLIL